MSCCHGNNFFPLLDGSCQSEAHKKAPVVRARGGGVRVGLSFNGISFVQGSLCVQPVFA